MNFVKTKLDLKKISTGNLTNLNYLQKKSITL